MEEIINFILNSGIGVVCVAYLIYFQNTTMKDIVKILNAIDKRLIIIETKVGIDPKDDER